MVLRAAILALQSVSADTDEFLTVFFTCLAKDYEPVDWLVLTHCRAISDAGDFFLSPPESNIQQCVKNQQR